MKFSILKFSALMCTAAALSPAEWRSQSIYQVLTDRFARTDGSTTATCNTGDQVHCGGSWKGIINKLDYIQDMGFTAVRTFFHIKSEGKLNVSDLDLSYRGKSVWG
jgi:alpha-amylase